MVPLIVFQPILIDVMQEGSDIMPFWQVETPVFDSLPGFVAFERVLGTLCLPANLTPILMVQDILNSLGPVVEVLTLG